MMLLTLLLTLGDAGRPSPPTPRMAEAPRVVAEPWGNGVVVRCGRRIDAVGVSSRGSLLLFSPHMAEDGRAFFFDMWGERWPDRVRVLTTDVMGEPCWLSVETLPRRRR